MTIQAKLNEIITLIKDGWATFLAVSLLLTPTIWLLAGFIYGGEIRALKSQIDTLQIQVSINQDSVKDCESRIVNLEAKKDAFKELAMLSNRSVREF